MISERRGGSTSSLIIEYATKVIAIGKHVCLMREVCATRVDEIDARKAYKVSVYPDPQSLYVEHTILLSNCLCPQMFLHSNRIISASFYPAAVLDSDSRPSSN